MQLSGGTPGTARPFLAGRSTDFTYGPNSSFSLGHSCPVIPQTTYFSFPYNPDSLPRSAELVWDFSFAPQMLGYLVLELWSASVILLQ